MASDGEAMEPARAGEPGGGGAGAPGGGDAGAIAPARAGPRVLVALSGTPSPAFALGALGALAARLGAELAGLYVEDERLRRFSMHGEAVEVLPVTGTARALDAATLARTVRAEAMRLEARLARGAEETGVRWTFQVAAGDVLEVAVRALAPSDVAIVGGGGSAGASASALAGGARRRPPSRPAVAAAPGDAVAWPERAGPLAAAVLGGLGGGRAARLVARAADLAEATGRDLLVLAAPGEAAAHARAAIAALGARARRLVRVALLAASAPAVPALREAVRAARARALLLAAPEVFPAPLHRQLSSGDPPLVLVP